MSSLYIQFSDEHEALCFVQLVPGFDLILGGDVLEAIYGDELLDATDDPEFWPCRRVLPRQRVNVSPHPIMPKSTMPMPWPTIIGYDGMPPRAAGVAMKAENGAWVPVARFDPPLSTHEQLAANKAALDRYSDRCAEQHVMGTVAATTLSLGRRP